MDNQILLREDEIQLEKMLLICSSMKSSRQCSEKIGPGENVLTIQARGESVTCHSRNRFTQKSIYSKEELVMSKYGFVLCVKQSNEFKNQHWLAHSIKLKSPYDKMLFSDCPTLKSIKESSEEMEPAFSQWTNHSIITKQAIHTKTIVVCSRLFLWIQLNVVYNQFINQEIYVIYGDDDVITGLFYN
ncbi:Hypothetical protein CINCED_3A004186 [Cinara cedri]|uniref:Uncharacterized protein n=1 Tax=Cinara cedri TaxID=506608 RepID=A0A5E4MCI1_9HEMI|nr:Hypothetical protein CINCED_3A004186 [Cinara cedri]